MPPTPTIKRIAGELGVSITTVSKVLNHRQDIGHATRARVLAKVAGWGFQPNARRADPHAPPPHPPRPPPPPPSAPGLDTPLFVPLVLRRNRRRDRSGGERTR